VHAAAIAATSQQLDALINGGMAEAEMQRASIEDVQTEDFLRFCEYAYRGDYTVPPWEEVAPEPSSTSGTNQQDDDDGWGFASLPSKKKAKKGRVHSSVWEEPAPQPELVLDEPAPGEEPNPDELITEPQYQARPISTSTLRTQFKYRSYQNNGGPKALILQQFEPKTNSAMNQNFTPVLLAHARLYCFAHVRLIAPLKALTLHKLHKTLTGFKLYTQRIGDIIELARYAYSSPDLPDRSEDGTLDDLRKLVVEYIVCVIGTIGKFDDFVNFMEEGGEFVGDFWRVARNSMA